MLFKRRESSALFRTTNDGLLQGLSLDVIKFLLSLENGTA